VNGVVDRARRLRLRLLGPRGAPPALRAGLKSLRPGAIAIDCGANVGHYTAYMAARRARVYAFEPNPHAFAILRRRFARAANVECREQAVAARDGTARLYLHARSEEDEVLWSVGSSLVASKGNVAERFVDVETIDLDAFIAGLHRPVSLLKLDVEGAEIAILARLLDSGRLAEIEHVLVEMHDTRIPALAEDGAALRTRLAAAGLENVRLDWD